MFELGVVHSREHPLKVGLKSQNAGDLITKEGVRGNVAIINLTRRLMPVIRYPMGDAAEWTE